MSSAPTEIESQHFTKAIVELGDKRAVVASEAIYNSQGIKIVEKGTAINTSLYERLMSHRLKAPIEHSVTADGAVDNRSLRQAMEDMLEQQPFYARMPQTAAQQAMWLDVIEKLPLPQPMAFQLTMARDLRPNLFAHSLRAGWTMIWLASGPLNLRFDLGMAAAVGLLHDIGMLHLDPALLDPKAQLTREQRRALYSHPIISTALLERHHEYPRDVIRAILEHHECDNGSGYPRNLTSAQISPLGHAMGLTELVSAMVGGDRQGGELRLSVLMRMNMHRYDRALIARVMGLIRADLDPGSHEVPTLEDPSGRLRDIDRVLKHWPTEFDALPGITPERHGGLTIVSGQLRQLRQCLAEAGLAPEQLDQLGDSGDDPLLPRELSLLAAEAAWQLRTLARQARRRWRAGAQGSYPPALQQWFEEGEALCQVVLDGIDLIDAPHD